MKFDKLLILKKSKKMPKEGDVFLLNPKENLFCFGKVIQTNVKSRDSFINGMNLIYIYDYFSQTKDIPPKLNNCDLLFVGVVNNQLWSKGYAENIDCQEVVLEEKNIDYAFWNVAKQKYVNIVGDEINRIPKYSGIFGLGSYGVIGKTIQKAIYDRKL